MLKAETTARSPLRSENAANTNWTQSDARTFVYDSWNLVRELHAQDSEIITNHYVWGIDLSGSLSGAGGIGGLLAAQLDTNSVVYCYDANGNVSELLDVSGSIAAHYEYSPFGETIVATGPLAVENKFRFSTKYFDDEMGLAYYGYRYYSPRLGRLLSRDPVQEAGGQNLYAFVLNDPINAYDPDGLAGCCGADHTESFNKALADANSRFDSHGWRGKFYGCFKMFAYPETGATAWDLNFEKAGVSDPCKETVTIGGTCYNMWDVNYALWGLGAKRCKLAFKAAKAEAWIYKVYKAVDNYFSGSYKPGAGGTPDGIWEFSGTMTGWSKYGFDYSSGSYPASQAPYKDCQTSSEKGTVTIQAWPW